MITPNSHSDFTIPLNGESENLSSNQKLAHEFEHGRQYEEGELNVAQNPKGNWTFYDYDRTDEAKAFQASFDAERPSPASGQFLNGLFTSLDGGLSAAVAYLGSAKGGAYKSLPAGPLPLEPTPNAKPHQ
jgi:hypothetical protein